MPPAPPGRPAPPQAPARSCPACGRALQGSPNRCPHCGSLLGEARHDLKRVAAEERARLARWRNTADALFLAGLLAGGPLLGFGGRVRLGLFVLLGGAGASAVYRWTRSSLPAALLIGGLTAGVVAVGVTTPAGAPERELQVQQDARGAYVAALASDLEARGGLAEVRGPDAIVVWLQLPVELAAECGTYPDAPTRTHLAELGFARVVIANEAAGGTVCSFKP